MSDPAEMVPSSYGAGAWPLMLPRVRHDRPERPRWEAVRLLSMWSLLEPGDLLIDVGSEMGDLSALYASWGCRVVLCEANPKAWPWARATFEANDLRHAGCWWGFVSDRAVTDRPEGGWFPAYRQDDWPNGSGALDPATGFVTEHERGHDWGSTTIDYFSAEVGHIDAITVDVEGAEAKVMRGARSVLTDHRPLVWISEHPEFMAEQGDDIGEMVEFMAECGYERRFLATDHETHAIYLPSERVAEIWPEDPG